MKEKEKKQGKKKAGVAKLLGAGDGDDRFAAIASDPRFARFPKAKARVTVDNRFKAVFDDPRFASAGKTDKRGRRTQGGENQSMKRYYKLDAGADKSQQDGDEPGPRAASDDDADDDTFGVPGLPERPVIRGMRGSVSPSSSDGAPPPPQSDEDDEDGEELEMEEGVLSRFVGGDEDVPMAEETRRLAVVDLEWDRIRAVDIFAVLQSFLPPAGTIKRVTVYLSDFGKQRLEEEERFGPRAAFSNPEGDDDDAEEEDGDKEVGKEKMRQYERERLRYYYAVAELDSRATGMAIYQGCDGMEFERSSTRLDLRFVPDEQSFEGKVVRDTAAAVPSDYVPVDYTSKALQQTNAQLSWDLDDPDRRKKLRRKLTADQLKEEDFAAFMGSDSDDEVGDPETGAEKLRALLLGTATGTGDAHRTKAPAGAAHGDDSDDDGEGDMVATFDSRLEEKLAARAAGTEKTVWEAYQDKKKEKKKDKKLQKGAAKVAGAGDDGAGGEGADGAEGEAEAKDAGFDDPFFMDPDEKKKKKKGKEGADGKPRRGAKGAAEGAADPEEARRTAELELLLMDDSRLRAGAGASGRSRLAEQEDEDDEDARGRGKGKKNKLSKKDRKKAVKLAKKEAASTDADGLGAGAAAAAAKGSAALDVSDTRFSALFTRPEFALDPTDPRYKTAGAVNVILNESAKRRKAVGGVAKDEGLQRAKKRLGEDSVATPSMGGGELGAIVANLKRKQSQRG